MLFQLLDCECGLLVGSGGKCIEDCSGMASIAAVGVVAVQSVAVVSELPWVIGVNELLSDMLADGVRGDGVLFESE